MPQPPAETLVREGTVLAGLVGRGIALSRTPAMHEAEGRATGPGL
jgi:shikimate dehydrogenase